MKEITLIEKAALIGSIFFFSFGIGLMVDGKKLLRHQVEVSSRVDYKNTLNPFSM
jgi:hypothetical protein